jgi:hypothetical protein
MRCTRCGAVDQAPGTRCSRCGWWVKRPAASSGGGRTASGLDLAVVVTLCCCAPVGVVAICHAADSISRRRAGDHEGAVEAARKAGAWCRTALLFSIAFALAWWIAFVLAGTQHGRMR